ncbi:MAG TPA: glycosyltransferase 87 family protein [Candidatus Polarisedimenticolia bacterium]|nr:glycosyltransferase 87 family protein [Candidatus Polarisedimenticolia bacterium]
MKASLRAVLLPFAATRAALLCAGLLGAFLLPSGLLLQKGNLQGHVRVSPVFDIWARWDSEWYLLIATRGYGADDAFVGLPVSYRHGDDAGFFPLYPMLLRGVAATGLPPVVAGVLVSNTALLLAAALLRRLVEDERGPDEADRAVWILLAFPTSFFLSAVYAESTMLAAILGSVLLARRQRALQAGALAGLAALARPTGLLAIVPLVLELGRSASSWTDRARRVVIGLLGPVAAIGGYMAFCQARFGEWAPFFTRQERWRGATGGPWRAFVRYFEHPEIHGAHHSTIDFVCAALLVLSLPWMVRRLRPADAAYGAVAILLPLGSTLWSYTRFASTLYPLPMLLARGTPQSDTRLRAILALFLPLGGLFMALFAAWWWVG